jgi:propanol-preferring alcohol dehydrogenase
MRAAILHKVGEGLRLEEVPVPKIGPKDVLVKVKAAGICHTDLGIVDGYVPMGKLPMILGHEVAGEIVEAGRRSRRISSESAPVSAMGLSAGCAPSAKQKRHPL